jgi:RimJ/RimL family protein N-acetyltransferase
MKSSAYPAPVLDTPHLRLRGHRYDDLPCCVAMWSDPDVVRCSGGEPSREQRTWARLLSYIGHWVVMGFGYWVLEQKGSHFKRDIAPTIQGTPEIGFALLPRFHGQRYATESGKAVLAWADAHLHLPRTVCLIDPKNAASLRVAEKCERACLR